MLFLGNVFLVLSQSRSETMTTIAGLNVFLSGTTLGENAADGRCVDAEVCLFITTPQLRDRNYNNTHRLH